MGETVNKEIQGKKKRQKKKDQTVKMNENEEVVNRKEMSGNSEESYEDSRGIPTNDKDSQIQYERGSSSKKEN